MTGKKISMAGMLGLFLVAGVYGIKPAMRVEPLDLYRAQNLKLTQRSRDLAIERRGTPWKFSASDRCNFTFFSPEVADVEFSEAGLSFKTTGKSVTLGWGNYDGLQSLQAGAERLLMFPGWNEIELEVSQTAGKSEWILELWADGALQPRRGYGAERLPYWAKPSDTQTLKGKGKQTVRFKVYRPGPDGFGLVVRGPAENRIVIESIKVTQESNLGYFRKSVTLPEGKIWRAVGEIVDGPSIYVNGVEIPKTLRAGIVASQGIDIAPLLKPGRENVIGLFAEQLPTAAQAPQVYFQGTVIMEDGREFNLDTDATWLTSDEAGEGWNLPGFETKNWAPASASVPSTTFLTRRWPVYDGRLLLENPGTDPKLYFNADAPVRIEVQMPAGLESTDAAVAWTLRRVERHGNRHFVAEGRAQDFRSDMRSGSWGCNLDLGELARGVYTIATRLEDGNRVVERRFEEPLVVVGKIPMKIVKGDEYEEGLELTLEKIIDFTDPNDPHMWVEYDKYGATGRKDIWAGERVAEPRIIERDGLRFREVVKEDKAAWFGYRFEFEQPHSWYMMVVEYPNDTERAIGVGINSAARNTGDKPLRPWRTTNDGTSKGRYETQAGPSISTGGKFPVDGKMHELRWLHWADPEIQIVQIVNRRRGFNAAAARLLVYRVKELPAVEINASGERDFGIHTERANYMGRTFGHAAEMGDPYQLRFDALDFDMVSRLVQRLRWHWVAMENYTQYMRFTGQNSHVMGAFQYNEVNLSYTAPDRVPGDGRLSDDIRETALRVFEYNGIDMYSMVEYVNHNSVQTEYVAGKTAIGLGADTISYVSRDGEPGDWRGNPNHPAVENGYLTVVDDLALKFSFSPAWKGIMYKVYVDNGGFGPSPMSLNSRPLDYDYSDATIAVFERDTGIKTPGDPNDPERFRMRYLFLTSEEMLPIWIEWRCQNTGDIVRKTVNRLHAYRFDLEVLYSYHDMKAMRYWLTESDLSYADYYRRLAMDPGAVKDEPHAWFGRTLYPTGSSRWETGYEYFWEQAIGPEVIEYYDQSPNRLVVLDSCWDEITTVADTDIEGWPASRFAARFIAQAHGDYALEAFNQAITSTDPDKLFFGFTDINIINSREQQVRQVARALMPLPKDKLEPVLNSVDFRHNLAIRALEKDGETWILVANPGYWPISGEIEFSGAVTVTRAYDGTPAMTRVEDGRTILALDMGPYGLASFRALGDRGLLLRGKVEITEFRIAPVGEDNLAYMREIMRDVDNLLVNDQASRAITGQDRKFMRNTLENCDRFLLNGEYAAAWADLTYWRFWSLRRRMQDAMAFSARLDDVPLPESIDPSETPVLTAFRVKSPPELDGNLDEEAWRATPVNTRFISLAGGREFEGIPLVDTAMQAVYDDTHLYMAMRMADPDVAALRAEANSDNPVRMLGFQDDMLAFLLQPGDNRIRQFGVNAGGANYALLADGGRWPGRAVADDLVEDAWQVAVGRDGGGWTVEAAIPLTSLDAAPPASGEQWRLNAIRRFRRFMVPEIYWARIKSGWGDSENYGLISFQ